MTVASVHSSSALPAPLLSPEAREDLHRYAEAGGFTLRAETNPWYAAFDSVARLDEARAASTVLAELRGRDVPGLQQAAERLTAVPGLRAPATVAEAAAVVVLLGRIRGTLSVLHPQAYVASSDTLLALAAATGTGAWRAERGVAQSWWHRTRLGRRARTLAATGRTRREDLHRALDEASSARAEWSALVGEAGTGAQPVLPQDLTFLDDAATAAETALAGLGRLSELISPTSPLEHLPLDELVSLLDALAADEGTLYRLPRLRELHDSLTSRGLTDLLAELTAEQADVSATTTLLAQRTAPQEESLAEREPEPEATDEPTAEADAASEPAAEAEAEPAADLPVDAEAELEPTEIAADADVLVEVEDATDATPEAADHADTQPEAATEPEADVLAEAGADTDATPEAAAETEADLPVEAEAQPADLAVEAEAEAAAEADVLVEVEDATDATPEAADHADTQPEAATEPEADLPVEPSSDTEATPEAAAEPASDVLVEAEAQPAGLAVEAEAEAEPEATEIAADAEVETEPAAATPAMQETDTATEAEADTDATPEATEHADTQPEAATEPEADLPVEAEADPAEVAVEAEAEAEPEVTEIAADAETASEVVAEADAAPEAEAKDVPVAAVRQRPDVTPGRPVTAYSAEQLEALVRWIDADGTVRTDEELLRAAMKDLGFSRLGPRIKEALGAAISAARG